MENSRIGHRPTYHIVASCKSTSIARRQRRMVPWHYISTVGVCESVNKVSSGDSVCVAQRHLTFLKIARSVPCIQACQVESFWICVNKTDIQVSTGWGLPFVFNSALSTLYTEKTKAEEGFVIIVLYIYYRGCPSPLNYWSGCHRVIHDVGKHVRRLYYVPIVTRNCTEPNSGSMWPASECYVPGPSIRSMAVVKAEILIKQTLRCR